VSDAKIQTPEIVRSRDGKFVKGARSPNPGGVSRRVRELRIMAQEHAPEAIALFAREIRKGLSDKAEKFDRKLGAECAKELLQVAGVGALKQALDEGLDEADLAQRVSDVDPKLRALFEAHGQEALHALDQGAQSVELDISDNEEEQEDNE